MRFFNKIDRYIIRQFLGTFLFILLIILAICIVIDVAEKIEDFLKADPAPTLKQTILIYYGNFCLFFGNLLSPLIVFLACIFVTSRLTMKTELVAILSGGVSFYRVLLPYLVTAFFIAGVSFYLNAYIVPGANQKRIDFEYEYLKNQRPMPTTNIHQKIATTEENGKKVETFFYVYRFNQLDSTGRKFTLRKMIDGDIVTRIDAPRIEYDTSGQWIIHKAWTRHITPTSERLVYRKRIDTTLLISPGDIYERDLPAERVALNELNDIIKLKEERGADNLEEFVLEKYERYAYPFAAIILTVIGFAVSSKKRRGGTPLMIGLGLVMAFLYVALVLIGQHVFGRALAPALRVFLANIIFGIVALVLLRIAPK